MQRWWNPPLRRLLECIGEPEQLRLAARHTREADSKRPGIRGTAERRSFNRAESDRQRAEARAEYARINDQRHIEAVERVSKVGRPGLYTEELADRVLEEVATTTQSLKTICTPDEMPCAAVIIRWIRDRPEFALRYTKAKEEQAELFAEECIDISNTPVLAVKTEISPLGHKVTTQDAIEHRRLQIETRKWYAAQMKPRKFGARVALTGAGGGLVNPTDADMMSDEQLQAIAKTGAPETLGEHDG